MSETYKLGSGVEGSNDNENFSISGNELLISDIIPENDSIKQVFIETQDADGKTRENFIRINVGNPVDPCVEIALENEFNANRVQFDFGDGPSNDYQKVTTPSGDLANVFFSAPYAFSFNYEFLPDDMNLFLLDGNNEVFKFFKSSTPGESYIRFKGVETVFFEWPDQSYFRFELDEQGDAIAFLNSNRLENITATGMPLGGSRFVIQGDGVNQITLDSMNIESPIGTTKKDIVPAGTLAGNIFPTIRKPPFVFELKDDVDAVPKESYEIRNNNELYTLTDVTSEPHNVKIKAYIQGAVVEPCEGLLNLVPGEVPNIEPIDIRLYELGVTASDVAGTDVGYLLTKDPDGQPSYDLVSGDGDDDNSSFVILDGILKLNVQLISGSYNIRVESSDGYGGSLQKSLSLTIAP